MLIERPDQVPFLEHLGDGPLLFDTDFEPGEVVLERIERVVGSHRTRFQRVDIVDTTAYGRALLLDGALQSAEADERVYHEALVHPALVTVDAPRDVLIIGGGEGATLREVLRHSTVRRAVMVDIDGELVDICRRDLQTMHRGAFENSRAEVRIQDGAEYLRTSPGRFDCLIYDLTDPGTDLPGPLLAREVLTLARQALAPGGALVMNPFRVGLSGLGPFALGLLATLRELFPTVEVYATYVHSFQWLCGYIVASDGPGVGRFSASQVDARLQAQGISDLHAYDGLMHQGMFGLPRWLRKSFVAADGAA